MPLKVKTLNPTLASSGKTIEATLIPFVGAFMRRISVLFIAGLLMALVPGAQAQTDFGTDDFDTGETVGAAPTATWYSYAGVGTVQNTNCETTQCYRQTSAGVSYGAFTLVPATNLCGAGGGVLYAEFDLRISATGSAALTQAFHFGDNVNGAGIIWGNDNLMYAYMSNGGVYDRGAGTPSVTLVVGNYMHVSFNANCFTGGVSATFSGSGVSVPGTLAFDTGYSLSSVTKIQFQSQQNAGINVDNLEIAFAEPDDIPTAPAGLRAEVVQNFDGNNALVELMWPLSTNDPEYPTGDGTWAYRIFLNGVSLGDDTTTSADGEGIRFALIDIGGLSPRGDMAFWITARNTNGAYGDQSCTVSVNDDPDEEPDIDSCGSPFPGSGGGGETSGPAQTTGNPLGNMVAVLNDAWGFDWSWVIGAIIMLVVLVPIAIATNGQALVCGAVIVIMDIINVKLGLWAEWSILVMVFLIIAIAANGIFNKKEDADTA